MQESYSEIEVRIFPVAADGSYPVEAQGDGRSFLGAGKLKLDRERLLLAESDPREYGLGLFDALFAGPLRDALKEAQGRAAKSNDGRLRVRLRIDPGAPELHAIFWERLYELHWDRIVPLATSALTPFSRFVALRAREPGPLRARPVRLLAVVSNPERLPAKLGPVDVDRHAEILGEGLGDLLRSGRMEATLLPGRTGLAEARRRALEELGFRIEPGAATLGRIFKLIEDRHILHYVGHGHFDEDRQRGVLHLEKNDGGWRPVKDELIVPRIAGLEPRPSLVFLAACESAKRGVHPFVGLGPRLVKDAGVPAVVAMQDLVPEELAAELTGHFYRRLGKHGTVDLALNEARNHLFESRSSAWAIPVLFMRLRDGRLLASDPEIEALEAICRASRDDYVPVPLEVLHVRAGREPIALETLARQPAPGADLLRVVDRIFHPDPPPEPETREARFAVLVGDPGTTKSTQLRRIVHEAAGRSLSRPGEREFPILVDLAALGVLRAASRNPVEGLVIETLRQAWPDLAARTLGELLEAHPGIRPTLLFDGSDRLPDRERREAWGQVQRLAAEYPDLRYLLVVDSANYDAARLDRMTDLLIIRPLRRRVIDHFLARSGPAGKRLYAALKRKEMFDLASIPWLLFRMLDQARARVLPGSRVEVLAGLAEEALAKIPARGGMRTGAERTLRSLAWRMNRRRAVQWSVEELFELMVEVRGNREYDLEALLDQLLETGLLSCIGDDVVRFKDSVVRDYFCGLGILALSAGERARVLEDICAALGRPTRLRWWRETLTLLSGLLRDSNPLLRELLYGASLGEGEEIFVAARCLQESAGRRGGGPVRPELERQLQNALAWRLDPHNERRPDQRERAAAALGRLRRPAAIPALARAANRKERLDWQGQRGYDYSSVRMAACRALRRMPARYLGRVEATDKELARLLRLWREGSKSEEARKKLKAWIRSGKESSRPLATFALADLYSDDRPDCLGELLAVFLEPATPPGTRWAVTDALTQVDPEIVLERAIRPFLGEKAPDPQKLHPDSWRKRAHWYERLAYLIGKVRIEDAATRSFLEDCLKRWKAVDLKARAIQALGRMQDFGYKELFESIAAGDLSGLSLSSRVSRNDQRFLRRRAIEALGSIGDRGTLERLNKSRAKGRDDWHRDLERALYRTSEEIAWRERISA